MPGGRIVVKFRAQTARGAVFGCEVSLSHYTRPMFDVEGGSGAARICEFATWEPCGEVFGVVEVRRDTQAMF